MPSYKRLLLFAHKGEASRFITGLKLKLVPGTTNFYENHDYFLLLCGGDRKHLLYRLVRILTSHHRSLKEVINLGICGAVEPNIALNSFWAVKTVYAYEGNQVQRKSYSLVQDKNLRNLNLMTLDFTLSDQRKLKEEISHFADLVDRELSLIAFACGEFKLPLRAYKLVSDKCEGVSLSDIKKLPEKYSTPLWREFLQVEKGFSSSKEEKITPIKKKITNLLGEGFYFTNSQKIIFHKKLAALANVEKLNDWVNLITEIDALKVTAKQKTQKLLKELEIEANSFSVRFQKKFQSLVPPALKEKQIKVDCFSLEGNKLKVMFETTSVREHEEKMEALAKVNFQKLFDLLNGKINV